MKKIIILILMFFVLSLNCTSQVVDSVVTYIGDSAIYKSIYLHYNDTTEVLFYKTNSQLPRAKWIVDDNSRTMSYFQSDTIYYKTTFDDLGDKKVYTNYYLNNNIWELQHTTVCYYSIPTYNIEVSESKSNLIVYKDGDYGVIVRILNSKNLLETIKIYNSSGQLIKTYYNVSSNRLKIKVNVKGLYIINATMKTNDNVLIDTLLRKKIIIM